MKKIVQYKNSATVVGTGLVALDIIISSNPDEPAYQWAGGTCGNVLTILSYLGWSSYPIARLNNDFSSIHVKEDMGKWGVKLNFSEMEPTVGVPIITQEISKNNQGLPVHKFHWKNCPKCGAWLPNYKAVTLNSTKKVKECISKCDVFFLIGRPQEL